MSILWIVDRDGQRLQEGLRLVPADGASNIVINIRRTTQLIELATEVRQRVRQPVNLVRFLSHGTSGEMLFSNGRITADNVRVLGFLRGLIRPTALGGSAGIEVHGCGIASDFLPPPRIEQGIGAVTIQNFGNMQGELSGWSRPEDAILSSRGVRFLLAMANVCGACVKGGIDYQLPDASWSYEGPSVTVCPNRQVRLEDPQNRYGLGQLTSLRIP